MEGGGHRLNGNVSRQKTYSAQNGYVYRYRFSGQASTPTETRYVFQVWSQGASSIGVTMVLEASVAGAWEARNRFRLTETQRYALAKMAFFRALDEGRGPQPPSDPLPIGSAQLAAIAATLDLI